MEDATTSSIPTRSAQQLGQALRRLRKIKGLTQADLAQQAGMRQPTVSSVEAGAPGTALTTIFSLLTAMDLELVVRERRKSARSPGELAGNG